MTTKRKLCVEILGWWTAGMCLCCLAAVSLPPFGGPDERAHLVAVQHYFHHMCLPQNSADFPWLRGETHQPPLYYVLSACILRVGGERDWSRTITPGRRVRVTTVLQNLSARQKRESLHRRKLRTLRLSWIPVHALVYPLTFLSGVLLVPARRRVARLAVLLHLGIPQVILVNSVVNNDGLANLLGSVLILEMVVMDRNCRSDGWTAVRLGIWMGLAAWTKLTVLLLTPVPFIVYFLSCRNGRFRYLAIGLSTGVLLLLPLWWYNMTQWSDPFCWRLMVRNYGQLNTPHPYSVLGFLFSIKSFFYHLPWRNPLPPLGAYAGFYFCFAVAVPGLVRHFLNRGSRLGCEHFMLACCLLSTAAMIRFQCDWLGGGQGRYLFPSLSGLMLLLSLGLLHYPGWIHRRLPVAGISAWFISAAVLVWFFE